MGNTLASEKMHLAKTAQEIESGLKAKVTLLETKVQEKAKAVAELRSEVEESKQKYTAEKACSDEKSTQLADLDAKINDLNGQVEVQAQSMADLTKQLNTLASEKMHLAKTAQEIESGLEAKVTSLETE